MKRVIFTLLFAFSAQVLASAPNLDGFNKRFKVERDDNGQMLAIKMKMFSSKFRLKPYFQQIATMVKEEIQSRRQKDVDYNAEVDAFIEQLSLEAKTADDQEAVAAIEESIRNLHNTNIEASMQKVFKGEVFKKFEKDLRDVLRNFSLSILANPNDGRFFYRRNVTYEVVRMALDFAKKKFSHIPLLNIASFVIVEVHNMLLEQRLYHQNMLLHYLSNFSESELGMTKAEIDHIYSSIYESRIAATAYMESNMAVNNWDFYGTDKYFTMLRTVNNRIRREAGTYVLAARYNFGFLEVKEEGKRLVKNALVNKHMLSRKMSTAWDYEKPKRIQRNRMLMQLGQLGIGFVPYVPSFIKNLAHQFLNSMYVEQRRWEGALFGYFESQGNHVMAKKVHRQIMNPYLLY
jgi:hypothetical protein